ncbi:transposase [Nocardia vaccinii]|uniref:transposase n=1 Tax=Nocardia vaccinii TaxID=1822 RepID=UPI0008296422|nr:transposase [Nocardia vaccinii]
MGIKKSSDAGPVLRPVSPPRRSPGAQIEALDEFHAAAKEFRKHPDYAVITSFPGLADLTGFRMLAEIGDDRKRFANARALKAYAGSAPVTRASGKTISISHRRIKNDRLAAVGWVWGTTMVVLSRARPTALPAPLRPR